MMSKIRTHHIGVPLEPKGQRKLRCDWLKEYLALKVPQTFGCYERAFMSR